MPHQLEILIDFANSSKDDLPRLNETYGFIGNKIDIRGRVKLFRNTLLRFVTFDSALCVPIPDEVNVRYSGELVLLLFSIPLKPLTQPVKEVLLIPE